MFRVWKLHPEAPFGHIQGGPQSVVALAAWICCPCGHSTILPQILPLFSSSPTMPFVTQVCRNKGVVVSGPQSAPPSNNGEAAEPKRQKNSMSVKKKGNVLARRVDIPHIAWAGAVLFASPSIERPLLISSTIDFWWSSDSSVFDGIDISRSTAC
ncbi:hypothetical protein L596_030825 [Steinernema carpocapsae]|uniref:Uncharacterized protein n=1 Tax=Steinernema carpocapsae TaxID=34508 RepID=A0A4U5LN65_STECR|nr:hypothetical protein L596_030825 [Steinernema carpocapsae]